MCERLEELRRAVNDMIRDGDRISEHTLRRCLGALESEPTREHTGCWCAMCGRMVGKAALKTCVSCHPHDLFCGGCQRKMEEA